MFKEFYLNEMQRFKAWSRTEYGLNDQESHDLYQEAQMYLYENIIHGRLTRLDSKLSTYLFAIAKNQLSLKFRKLTVRLKHEDKVAEHLVFLSEVEVDEGKQKLVQRMTDEIRHMLEPCKSLLILFYYENLSFSIIADRMGYKNANVAKNQKKRCLEKLRAATQS